MFNQWGSPGGTGAKNLPANAGDARDLGSISERSPRVGNGTPLQYSCLGNPMDREAWWVTVHEVSKSQTLLSDSTHIHTCIISRKKASIAGAKSVRETISG